MWVCHYLEVFRNSNHTLMVPHFEVFERLSEAKECAAKNHGIYYWGVPISHTKVPSILNLLYKESVQSTEVCVVGEE